MTDTTQREADERALMEAGCARRYSDGDYKHTSTLMRLSTERDAYRAGWKDRAAIDQSASTASLEKLRAIGAEWMGAEGRDALEDWIAQQAAPEAPASEQQADFHAPLKVHAYVKSLVQKEIEDALKSEHAATTVSASKPAYGLHTEAAGAAIRQAGLMDQAEVLCEAARRATNKYWSRVVEDKDKMIVELARRAPSPSRENP